MAHWTNLVIQIFSSLPLVFRIENLLQCLYDYFSHRPKRHLEFTKLAKIMETKGNKIFYNIEIRWISTINLVKWVLFEYCTLLMKMVLNATIIPSSQSNLSLLIDVETLLGLNAMMPLLEAICSLIKFAQLRDVCLWFHSSNEDLWRGCVLHVLW